MTVYGTTSIEHIQSILEYTITQDLIANTTTIEASLYYISTVKSVTTLNGDFTLNIGGDAKTEDKTIHVLTDKGDPSINHSVTIEHYASGKNNMVWVHATFDGTVIDSIPIAYGSDGLPVSFKTTTGAFTTDTGELVQPPTIARPSEIHNVVDKQLGEQCYVCWTPRSEVCYYKITFSYGEWSETTDYIEPKTEYAYEYTGYKFPLDIANYMGSRLRGGIMSVVLTTYGIYEGDYINVGKSKALYFTVTLPETEDTKPVITSISTNNVNISPYDVFKNAYISEKSKVTVTTSAEGRYGAEIASCEVTVDDERLTGTDVESSIITKTGNINISVKVTDSRGFTNTATTSVTFVSYLPPSLARAVLMRSSVGEGLVPSEAGTYLYIQGERTYSAIEDNVCSVFIQYRRDGLTEWSDAITILDGTEQTNAISKIVSGVALDANYSYHIRVICTDNTGLDKVALYSIASQKVTFELAPGGEGAAFGKHATEEGGFEVAWDAHFDRITTLNSIKLGGTDIGSEEDDAAYYSVTLTPQYHHRSQPIFIGIEEASGNLAVAWLLHIDSVVQYCNTLYKLGDGYIYNMEADAANGRVIIYLKGATKYTVVSSALLEIAQTEYSSLPEEQNNGILKINTI